MTLMPISKIITMIDNHGFVRIHRSFIVNMSKVAEVAKNNVKLIDGTTLPIGDSFKDNVKEYIQPKIV
jgi:DNA-binding LytR/AlgR family response regulator